MMGTVLFVTYLSSFLRVVLFFGLLVGAEGYSSRALHPRALVNV